MGDDLISSAADCREDHDESLGNGDDLPLFSGPYNSFVALLVSGHAEHLISTDISRVSYRLLQWSDRG